MVLSCAALNSYEPMRFAGTWKQYSKNAMPQLAIITFGKASLRYFKWPYHAKVMKIFSRMVRTNSPYEFDGNQPNEKGNDSSGNARRPVTADINRAFHNLIEYEPVA